jgi:hypothetical protein
MKPNPSAKVPHLHWRPTKVADLEACFPLIRDRFLHPTAAARKNLLALWKHLVETGAGLFDLMFLENPPDGTTYGFPAPPAAGRASTWPKFKITSNLSPTAFH